MEMGHCDSKGAREGIVMKGEDEDWDTKSEAEDWDESDLC